MVAKFEREGEPVTRVDLEVFGRITLSNGSRLYDSAHRVGKICNSRPISHCLGNGAV